MKAKEGLFYTKEHEWAKEEGPLVVVGITDFAQSELGDVVFVDLPEVGRTVNKGDSLLTVESVKAVSDVYAPLSGTVKEVNTALSDAPEKLNEDPFKDGWIVKLEVEDSAQLKSLMDSAAYSEFLAEISK